MARVYNFQLDGSTSGRSVKKKQQRKCLITEDVECPLWR